MLSGGLCDEDIQSPSGCKVAAMGLSSGFLTSVQLVVCSYSRTTLTYTVSFPGLSQIPEE